MIRPSQLSGLPESNPTKAEGLLADLHLDLPLLTGLILLCGFGLLVLYSAQWSGHVAGTEATAASGPRIHRHGHPCPSPTRQPAPLVPPAVCCRGVIADCSTGSRRYRKRGPTLARSRFFPLSALGTHQNCRTDDGGLVSGRKNHSLPIGNDY